jgi:hypothetical protein
LVAVATAIGAGVAHAGPTLKFVNVNPWGGSSSGGPFEVFVTGLPAAGLGQHGAGASNYLTFCVEKNETIQQGQTYDATVNTAAVNGGAGGGNPDPLDYRTAYLYTAFIKGTLSTDLVAFDSGSAFSYGTASHGTALQSAIWKIEQEVTGSVSTLAQRLLDLAAAKVAGDWGSTIGNVRVLNLTKNGHKHQDQLIIIPLPTAAGMGLAGLGLVAIRRRR